MATATAVKKLTMPMPLSLSAALVSEGVTPRPTPEDVFVGSSEVVVDALIDSEAEMAEESKELAMVLANDDAVPVADSVADAEASASVEDIL
jgi:hypothetical protein